MLGVYIWKSLICCNLKFLWVHISIHVATTMSLSSSFRHKTTWLGKFLCWGPEMSQFPQTWLEWDQTVLTHCLFCCPFTRLTFTTFLPPGAVLCLLFLYLPTGSLNLKEIKLLLTTPALCAELNNLTHYVHKGPWGTPETFKSSALVVQAVLCVFEYWCISTHGEPDCWICLFF